MSTMGASVIGSYLGDGGGVMFSDWFDQQNDTGVLTSSERELMRQAYVAGMRVAAGIARRSSFLNNDMVADSIERAAEREEQ